MTSGIGVGFRARLRREREALGLGVNDLDRLVGESLGQASRLESGTRSTPSIVTVARYADALGVTIDWLWRGRGPRDGGRRKSDARSGTSS